MLNVPSGLAERLAGVVLRVAARGGGHGTAEGGDDQSAATISFFLTT